MQKINILHLITVLTCFGLFSCQPIETKNEIESGKMDGDDKIVVLKDSAALFWVGKSVENSWQPDSADWKKINAIFRKAEKDGVFKFLKVPTLKYMEQHYYRQFVFYKNDKYEKLVYVNAFYEIDEVPVSHGDSIVFEPFDWKENFVFVEDGGMCYWQMTLNLTKDTYFNFDLNAF